MGLMYLLVTLLLPVCDSHVPDGCDDTHRTVSCRSLFLWTLQHAEKVQAFERDGHACTTRAHTHTHTNTSHWRGSGNREVNGESEHKNVSGFASWRADRVTLKDGVEFSLQRLLGRVGRTIQHYLRSGDVLGSSWVIFCPALLHDFLFVSLVLFLKPLTLQTDALFCRQYCTTPRCWNAFPFIGGTKILWRSRLTKFDNKQNDLRGV